MVLLAGSIPLRQLVYRVLDLPPSMRPLVYDFGQLSDQTEKEYTLQIVKNHVRKYSIHPIKMGISAYYLDFIVLFRLYSK